MAAPENVLVTDFHFENSGEAVVRGPGVDSPEDFPKISIAAVETLRVGSSICEAMFSWIAPDVFSG